MSIPAINYAQMPPQPSSRNPLSNIPFFTRHFQKGDSFLYKRTADQKKKKKQAKATWPVPEMAHWSLHFCDRVYLHEVLIVLCLLDLYCEIAAALNQFMAKFQTEYTS